MRWQKRMILSWWKVQEVRQRSTLKSDDIVNMGLAKMAECTGTCLREILTEAVYLHSLCGTMMLLERGRTADGQRPDHQ